MSKFMKKFMPALLIAAVVLSLCGCEAGEGEYTLYYTNSVATKLISYTYESESTEAETLFSEFFTSMQQVEEDGGMPAVPDTVEIDSLALSGDVLTVELTGSLVDCSAGELLMFYNATTKSAAQLSTVSGLVLNINGKSVCDINGKSMGIMRQSRFVNNAVDDPEDYRESSVNFYFSDSTGEGLVKIEKSIRYRSTTTLERAVLENLISGPEAEDVSASGEKLQSALPKELTVLGISTHDNTCFVNVDDKLIKEVSNASTAIYSIVNTLLELPGIENVQITVNGVSDVTTASGLSLSEPFTKNETIVHQ